MEYVTLNNGVKMPILGYGVYRLQRKNVKDAYSMRLKLDTVQLIRRRVILMSVVSGKGSAPVESREKTYLLCQKLQQSTRHMSRQWRESMKP